MTRLTGGCLCGDVRYEIDVDPMFAGHCHCRDCQRTTGAAVSTIAAFPAGAVRVVQGTPSVFESQSDRGSTIVREFCGRCGSRLFSSTKGGDRKMVSAGSLDDPNVLTPAAYVFAKSRLKWAAVHDQLPSFEEMPPGF